ncbi:MAG: enoyl-CoA hydratase/isomerase family protein [Polyangiales bacterium]
MSAESSLHVANHGPIQVLTMNRPASKNAFNVDLATRIQEALTHAAETDEVRVVILTGAGSAFSAGADVSLFAAMAAGPAPEAKVVDALPHAIRAFPKPIFAAVQGVAVGMAVTMLPFFDGVYVSDRASFMLPFVRLGLVQEFGSSKALSALIGKSRMAEMLYTARNIDATTAERWGLATRVFDAENLLEEVIAVAADVLLGTPTAVLDAKRLLNYGADVTFEEALAAEDEVLARRYGCDENLTAVKAFLSRKK